MELKLVMVVVQLIDICAFQLHDLPNLFIVEYGDRIAGKSNAQQSFWHCYIYSPAEARWQSCSSFTQTIPNCGVIKASAYNNVFFSVLQSNSDNALVVTSTVLDPDATFRQKSTIPVDLSVKSLSAIKIPAGGSFSTLSLPVEGCLFNPHILALDETRSIVIANAIDASARIFNVDKEVIELTSIDHCIEPCIINTAGKNIIVFRKCPEDWLVFYSQPNTRMAPELLPLVIYTCNNNLSVTDTNYLSKGWITGGSFAFDVCSTKDNKIILATVTGLLNKPYLQIMLSPDAGTRWKEYPSIALEEVPYRLKVAATGSRILVACTFKKHDGFHVMAAEFNR